MDTTSNIDEYVGLLNVAPDQTSTDAWPSAPGETGAKAQQALELKRPVERNDERLPTGTCQDANFLALVTLLLQR